MARPALTVRAISLLIALLLALTALAACHGPASPAVSPSPSTPASPFPAAPTPTGASIPSPSPGRTPPIAEVAPAAASPSPTATAIPSHVETPSIQEYPVPEGLHPYDVAPAPDGTVWYTAQVSGELGRLDPATGETRHIPLGQGSRPHGVIVGSDGAPGSPTAA